MFPLELYYYISRYIDGYTYEQLNFVIPLGPRKPLSTRAILDREVTLIEFNNDEFYEACKYGYMEIVRVFMKHKVYWNMGIRGAYEGGHLNIIKLFEDNDHFAWNDAFRGACAGGHRDLIEYTMQHGACNFDIASYEFYKHNHTHLMDLFITHWGFALEGACIGGHERLITDILEKHCRQIDEIYRETVTFQLYKHNPHLSKLFDDIDVESALAGACAGGREDYAIDLLQQHNLNSRQALIHSCDSGNNKLIGVLAELVQLDQGIFNKLASAGNKEMFEKLLLVTQKKISIPTCAIEACRSGRLNMIKYFETFGLDLQRQFMINVANEHRQYHLVEYLISE